MKPERRKKILQSCSELWSSHRLHTVVDSGDRVLLVNKPVFLCICPLWQLHLHQVIKLSHASYIRYGATIKKILKDFPVPWEKKTFKEIQVVKTLHYEKLHYEKFSRPTGISPTSTGLGSRCLLFSIVFFSHYSRFSHFPPIVSFSQCAVFPIIILTSASPQCFTFPHVALE